MTEHPDFRDYATVAEYVEAATKWHRDRNQYPSVTFILHNCPEWVAMMNRRVRVDRGRTLALSNRPVWECENAGQESEYWRHAGNEVDDDEMERFHNAAPRDDI